MFQKASFIILSNFTTSAGLGVENPAVKYCSSIVPDWCARTTPEYVFCCPESPNAAMAVTLRGPQNRYATLAREILRRGKQNRSDLFFLPVRMDLFSDHRLGCTF